MLLRPLAGFVLAGMLAQSPAAPPAQEPESPTDQEPRVKIQIDVVATVPDDEHWIELQSRSFVAAGTASEGDIRRITADLELLRETFAQLTSRVKGVSSVPATLIVFRDASSFGWYKPNEVQSSSSRGYVRESADKLYIVMPEAGSIPREIYRDYVKFLIPESMAPVPLWFREGLADYFSTMKVNRFYLGDKRWIRLGAEIDEYQRLLDKKARLLPFEDLFKVTEESPDYTNADRRKLFLAESWGVIHYLMSRPGGLVAMQRAFNLMGDGQSVQNALQQSLGRNPSFFEADFKRYIQDSQKEGQWSGSIQLLTKSANQVAKGECGGIMLPFMNVRRIPQCYWEGNEPAEGVSLIPYSFDKTWSEISPLKARTLAEGDAWFYRGDLMLHIGRFGEAEAYLQRAELQLPASSRIRAAEGMLQWQQKHFTEAEASLTRALELDPKNYLALYYRAVFLQVRGFQIDTDLSYEDLEEIHTSLLKAVSLAPHFATAADFLGGINLLRHTSMAESRKVLTDAISRYPGRSASWILLANVVARSGDPGGARWLMTRLLSAGAPDAGSRQSAMALLEGLAPGAARALITAPATSAASQGGTVSVSRSGSSGIRKPNKTEGEKLSGLLMNIECRNGLTLTVKSGGKTVKLHTNSAFSVDFIVRDRDDRAISSDPVVCGPTTEEGIDVSIAYRPASSGNFIGEPLVVEIRAGR